VSGPFPLLSNPIWGAFNCPAYYIGGVSRNRLANSQGINPDQLLISMSFLFIDRTIKG
jgi:hypothetical protein